MSKIEKEIQQIIDARHDNAIRIADENLRLVLENETIKKLYNECNSIKFDIAKYSYEIEKLSEVGNIIDKNKENIAKFNNKISRLEEKLSASRLEVSKHLKNLNINIKSLKPTHVCDKCKDTGWVDKKRCTCFKSLLNNKLLLLSGINKKLPSFDKLDYSVYNKETSNNIKVIVKTMQDIVKKYHNISKNLMCIFGKVGVGKTYLSECFVNYAIENNLYTVYTTSYNLNQDMLKYHLAPINEKNDILDKYINCDILCIDDLGTENILKNVTVEYLYLILNERSQKGKFTLISTNLTLSQIKDIYDERIFSRLVNKDKNIVINLEGDDLRLKK